MLKSYYDIKLENSSKIFESHEIEGLEASEIIEAEKIYYSLVEQLEKNKELDEGVLGGILGGVAGALIGPAVGKAICKVLGIDPKGTLGTLLTSRLVTTAFGVSLGAK